MFAREGRDYLEYSLVEDYIVNAFVSKVFVWMFIGLVITAATTAGIIFALGGTTEALEAFFYTSRFIFFVLFVAQIIIIGSLGARIQALNPVTAKILYIVYAMSNGLTVGMLVTMYAMYIVGIGTVVMAFGITGASFGIMAVYGLVSKKDLTSWSSLLFAGLIGVIIASVANWFLGNYMLDFIICVVGLFIFLGLVAVDSYKIKNYFARVAVESQRPDGTVDMDKAALASNLAIYGALMLYLDFINMLLFILRLLGRRR